MRIRTALVGAAIAGLAFTAAPAASADQGGMPNDNSDGNACFGQLVSGVASNGLPPGQLSKMTGIPVAGKSLFNLKRIADGICR